MITNGILLYFLFFIVNNFFHFKNSWTNNITNIRDQWPLSHNDMYTYCLEKYGSDAGIQLTHHWETQEIKDKYNRTILTGGLEVDENFTFTYAKDDYSSVTVSPA